MTREAVRAMRRNRYTWREIGRQFGIGPLAMFLLTVSPRPWS